MIPALLVDSGVNSTALSIGGNAAAEIAADRSPLSIHVASDRACTLSVERYNATQAAWYAVQSETVATPGDSFIYSGAYGRVRVTLTVGTSSAWNAQVWGAAG
jgi:hypothetical protein